MCACATGANPSRKRPSRVRNARGPQAGRADKGGARAGAGGLDEVPVKVLRSDASYEWRSVLCESNATDAKISEIQRALKSRGFCQDEVDGKLSPKTMAAVEAFEKANGLPVDDQLNIETVTAPRG